MPSENHSRYALSLSVSGISCGQGRFETEADIETLSADLDFPESLGISIAVSRRFESLPIRAELEAIYCNPPSNDGSMRLFWVDADLGTDLDFLSGMFNIYYEIPMELPVFGEWRVDAGLGYGYAISRIAIDLSLGSDSVADTLAQWDDCCQLILGVSHPIGQRFELFLHYRYLMTGEIVKESNRIDLPDMHSANLGVRMLF